MHTLTHFRLCPLSRAARLALAELEIETELVEERPWEWRAEFLALNPAGELPVLQLEGVPPLCGLYAISEYLGEAPPPQADEAEPFLLFPGDRVQRSETRRLIDWFNGKFNREVTQELLQEKVYTRLRPDAISSPDVEFLRAIRTNLRYHVSYVNHLADRRRWLAGDEMSFADLAAAAHLSIADYLGEAPWEEFSAAKTWYARLKSRRAFRSLLADRVPGALPAAHYADLDF
ncbi:MAG: glutathione S-transferase family protein [Hyphomicrobium sp.]|jgi:glutathione S-transferase